MGVNYIYLKNVYQLIFYTGKPIKSFSHYYHVIQKGDIHRQLTYSGEKVKTILLQLQLLKEEFEMEKPLHIMEQLDYLFTHNQPHSYSELNSLVEEVMNMHQKFIQSDEEMIKSYGIEQERLLIESRMMRN